MNHRRDMRRGSCLALGASIAAIALSVAPPLSAHHAVATKFDSNRTITLVGRVTHVSWANPHVHVFLHVEDGEREGQWYVELPSRVALERAGWHRDTLRTGEAVSVEGPAARDGSRQVAGASVVQLGTRSSVFTVASERRPLSPGAAVVRPTPRWPDRTPRLGPPPGGSGYWVPTRTVLIEDGVDVEVDESGLLAELSDAARVAPFQEWALHLYLARQRDFLRSDPAFVDCKPPAGPRKWLVPYGIQLIEERPHQRIFVVTAGGNRDWHLIYTDGRALDGGFGDDDGNFLYYGRNVGAWQGETFVIEATGFNERFWFAPGGLPHTEQLRLVERITRPDFDTLHYHVTIDDPGAYTRPWTSSWTLEWVEGEDPPEYYCQDNRP